jgi:hypothetical protein
MKITLKINDYYIINNNMNVPYDMVKLLKDMDPSLIKPFPFKVTKNNKTFFMKIIPVLNEMEKVTPLTSLETYSSCNEYYIHKKIIDELNLIHVPKLLNNECYLLSNDKINILRTSGNRRTICKTLMNVKKCIIEYSKYDTQPYSIMYATQWINESIDIDTLSEIIPKLSISNEQKSDIWRNIIFQVLYTLYILQKKYKFMHNDFHNNNILIEETTPGGYYKYEIEGLNGEVINYYIPNIGYIVKITDFEWATIENYPNSYFEEQIVDTFCDKIDLFLFVSCLLDCDIPSDLQGLIRHQYGNEILDGCDNNERPYFDKQRLTKKGYQHYKNNMKTPYELLTTDYFIKFKNIEFLSPMI